jgi:hypothetical protein
VARINFAGMGLPSEAPRTPGPLRPEFDELDPVDNVFDNGL